MPPPQQLENLELLLEVGRLLSSKLELSDLLHTIMQLAARVVNAETASLLLVDPKTEELYFDVALGLDPEFAKIRLKSGEGIAGAVAKENRPLIINDTRNDTRWTQKIDKQSGFVTRSILAAPIAHKGKCIGVIEAINHIDGDFSFSDLRIFEAFASQCAVAIENARLFASLQEEKFKLSTIFNEMRDAAALTDGEGTILIANAAARSYLGDHKIPAPIHEVVRGFSVTPPLAEIVRSAEAAVRFDAVREQPKALILEGTALLVKEGAAGKVRGRVLLFRDVTEERHEEGLKRNFLSLISHKLKTPLASITGYSQLLLGDLKGKPGQEFTVKALDAIQTQGQKLSRLVEKLLNYTVLEQLDSSECAGKPFSVDDILKDALKALTPFIEEARATVDIQTSPGLTAVGDPVLIRDAVKDLVENGVKFSLPDKARVTVWAERQDDWVHVHVRDAGPGIPPEEHDRIFQRFYQVESSFTGQVEGWGLGLSFVQKVLRKLGGSVRVRSAVGEGSTFTLSLPAETPGV